MVVIIWIRFNPWEKGGWKPRPNSVVRGGVFKKMMSDDFASDMIEDEDAHGVVMLLFLRIACNIL